MMRRRLYSSIRQIVASTKDTEGVFVCDKNRKIISPWHDIPLNAEKNSKLFNFICEIPSNTYKKMEVSTKVADNPIVQDRNSDGSLRQYYGPIYWNYGCFPRTWEDPNVKVHGYCGDKDPIDVVEIGTQPLECGSITEVKVVGALGLVDVGEIDWKIIAINKNDLMYDKVNDIADLERSYPAVVSGVREWFRWYKYPAKRRLNEYIFNGKVIDKEDAMEVIYDTHKAYLDLISGKTKNTLSLWLKH